MTPRLQLLGGALLAGTGIGLIIVLYAPVATMGASFLAIAGIAIGWRGWQSTLAPGRDDDARTGLQLLELCTEKIVVMDADWRIVKVNHTFCRITGYAESEALDRMPGDFCSVRHTRTFYAAIVQHIECHDRWAGEVWYRHKSGNEYAEQISITVLRNEMGAIARYIAIANNDSSHAHDEALIDKLRDYDSITGLPNWNTMNGQLERAINRARLCQTMIGILLLDLDHFKNINETRGHANGDKVLEALAARLNARYSERHIVARGGGDEFVIILIDLRCAEEVTQVAGEVLALIAQPLLVGNDDDDEFVMTASIGLSIFPQDADNTASLLQNADIAVHHAKHQGRNTYRCYQPQMSAEAQEQAKLKKHLHNALERQQLSLRYQPQVSLADGRIVAAEALLRWQHPELGMIPPSKFIPLAEENCLIVSIGDWVLRTACAQARAWHDAGHNNVRMAVNLSPRQFRQHDLVDRIERIVTEAGLAPSSLELEITEGCLMEDPERVAEMLHALKRLGMRISVDDFGTGFSSLSYLRRFPLDCLKIDRSFSLRCCSDLGDAAIVEAIIGLARALHMEVLAEGVETSDQLDFMIARRCDSIQGYLFSRPLLAEQFTARLETGNCFALSRQAVSS